MPPFLGFIPKIFTFHMLTINNFFPIAILLLLGTTINLSYYINIIFNLFSPTHTTKKSQLITTTNIFLSILATTPLILIAPLTLYAMTVLNQSQRYWNTIFYLRNLIGSFRNLNKNTHSSRTRTTRITSRK